MGYTNFPWVGVLGCRSLLHVDFRKRPCQPVVFRGQGPFYGGKYTICCGVREASKSWPLTPQIDRAT